MKKIIKSIGNSKGITFSPEELKIYKMDTGDVIDVEVCVLTRKGDEE